MFEARIKDMALAFLPPLGFVFNSHPADVSAGIWDDETQMDIEYPVVGGVMRRDKPFGIKSRKKHVIFQPRLIRNDLDGLRAHRPVFRKLLRMFFQVQRLPFSRHSSVWSCLLVGPSSQELLKSAPVV